MTRKAGCITWFGEQDLEGVRREFGIIELDGEFDFIFFKNDVLFAVDSLKAGTTVTFDEVQIRGKDGAMWERALHECYPFVKRQIRGRASCAVAIKLLSDERDIEFLRHLFVHQYYYPIVYEVAERVLGSLSKRDQIEITQARLERITPQWLRSEVTEYLPYNTILHPLATDLRALLPTETRFELYATLGDITPYLDEIKETRKESLIQERSNVYYSQKAERKFWQVHPPLSVESDLFPLAPASVKKQIWQKHYAELIGAIEGIATFDPPGMEWPAERIYKDLTLDDVRLARQWEDQNNEFEQAKMLSARAAERVAKLFYEGLGYSVEDIALHQVQGNNSDWMTHDLLLDREIAVDVKNARSTVNSKSYVEHGVPRFKQDRRGEHVRIAAVLSPYLQLEYIKNPEDADFRIDPICYLGETSRRDINELEQVFTSSTFEVHSNKDRVISLWLLNYPSRFYAEQDERISFLRNCVDWPTDEAWAALKINALPALLAVGLPLSPYWHAQLELWQQEFYEKVRSHAPPSIPKLFLCLLTHFLEMTAKSTPPEGYAPENYKDLLYQGDTDLPIGLYDPMKVIENLCITLGTLWKNRERINLNSFRSFRFQGEGLLLGRKSELSAWTTIIAYCGGWIEGQGKCGFSPLLIGEHHTCSECQKLICKKCDYCSGNCSRNDKNENPDVRSEGSQGLTARNSPLSMDDDYFNGPPLDYYD